MKKILIWVVATMIFWGLWANSFAESGRNDSTVVIKAPKCSVGSSVSIPIGDAEYLDIGNGCLWKISDLPSFSSQSEANSYIRGLRNAISHPTQHNPTINFDDRSTHGNARVASITYNGINTLALWVEFTTSGNSNTGVITYHNAYTTFTGFTLGIAWHQINCRSEVTSSGKDIYASATGELAYYLLVDGMIELGREAANLSGYCCAVH